MAESPMHPDTEFILQPTNSGDMILRMIEPSFGSDRLIDQKEIIIARAMRGDDFNNIRWVGQCLATFHKKKFTEVDLFGEIMEEVVPRG